MKFLYRFFIILSCQLIFLIPLSLMKPVINKNTNRIDNIKVEKSQYKPGVVPNRYNIKFRLNSDFTFTGEVEIQAQVISENNQIVLNHGSNIVINSFSITNNETVINISSRNYIKKKEKLSFYLNDTLPVDSTITISISYTGDVSKHIKSLLPFSYWNKDQVLKKIKTLRYELSSAKEVVPCISCHWRDRSEVNISITIRRPKTFIHPKHRLPVNVSRSHGYALETYHFLEPRTINIIPFLITEIGKPSIRNWIEKYNFKLWSSTIESLRGQNYITIDEINRSLIIDYLFNLSRTNLIGYDVSLSAAQYLVQERSYLPWKTAFKHFELLSNRLIRSDLEQKWKKYLFSILNEIYYELGFTEDVDDSKEKKMLRSDIIKWTCWLSHFDCISRSSQIFHSWKLNGSKSISAMLQQTVFCSAIKWGSDDDWNFLWAKYLQTNVTSEKKAILHALGCTENPEIINKLLTSAITKDSGIQLKDSRSVFTSVYSSGPIGAMEVSNFIQHNHQKMLKYYKSDNRQLWKNPFIHMLWNDFKLIKRYDPKIFEWLSYKYPDDDRHLPRKVKPLEYHIRIIPNLKEKNSAFGGSVSIMLEVVNHTSCIVLHAKDLFISKISVYNFHSSIPYVILNYSYDEYDKLSIYLGMIVSSGSRLILDIEYTGFINEQKIGLFQGSYEDENGNTHLFAATQLEKLYARQVFPCFDEPAFKAAFKISIMRPNYYSTLSNMKLKHSVASGKSNWTWDHYEKSIPMSTYLVAFIIFDYKYNYTLNDNYKFWSSVNLTNDANHALKLAQKAVDYLEDYTDLHSLIKKLDFVIIPDFHVGGMENWGLITLDHLYPINFDKSFLSMFYESIVVHEVTHMWFGNLVTCDSWEYLWLNEGFATYFQWNVMESIRPKWRWIDTFIVHEMFFALEIDSAVDSKSMNEKQRDYIDDLNDLKTTSIMYIKAACIIRMVEHAFGAKVLHNALKYYLKENQLKTVTPSKLWAALDMKINEIGGIPEVNQSVSTLMESWTSQSGYPVVHVNRVNGNLSLTQERFFITKRNESSTQLYWIPISIASKTNPNFSNTSPTLWMGSKKMLTSLSIADDEWFILNVQQTGFYRVNYDVITWKNLFKALNQDNFGGISEIHRAQIINDLFNLARGGYISYDLVIAGSKYLLNEKSKLPWQAFNENFHTLNKELNNEDTKIYSKEHFKKLIFFSRDEIISTKPLDNEQLNKMKQKLLYFWSCRQDYNNCMYQERSSEKRL